jgi:hypothetical protein
MKSSKWSFAAVVTAVVFSAAAAAAAGVDMKDPRRAIGRDDDIRIDAEILQESLSPHSGVHVTYQVHNQTALPVAIADRVAESSYDLDSQTITLSIGSEVPAAGAMPHVVVIGAGETKVLHGGAMLHVDLPHERSAFASVPRYVQIKVNVLRDLQPFAQLIEQQERTPRATLVAQKLDDALFEKWVESNDAIFLNSIPVRWNAAGRNSTTSAEEKGNF